MEKNIFFQWNILPNLKALPEKLRPGQQKSESVIFDNCVVSFKT